VRWDPAHGAGDDIVGAPGGGLRDRTRSGPRAAEDLALAAAEPPCAGLHRRPQGTPLLVQITIIYFTPASIGIRPKSLFSAGLVALTLNSAAYIAEIFRSGIQSIDKAQMEAGRASGLSYGQTMRYIIVPQAFRRVIPPLTNAFMMLIKDTWLVSVIGLVELLRAAQEIQSQTFNSSALIAAALIYLTNILERRLNRRVA
jgi:ABC-type amino acid transport system permease subunit